MYVDVQNEFSELAASRTNSLRHFTPRDITVRPGTCEQGRQGRNASSSNGPAHRVTICMLKTVSAANHGTACGREDSTECQSTTPQPLTTFTFT